MLNTEFDHEYVFDINAYLIEEYSKMNLTTRRTVCRLVMEDINDHPLQDFVDEVVQNLAIEKMKWVDPDAVEESEDEEDEE